MTDQPPAQQPTAGQATEADGSTMRTELPADLTSARQARSAIRQALTAWRMERLSGDAELLASELVANAAEHGDGAPISLALRRHTEPGGRPGLTCEVTDTSPVLPRPRQDRASDERGRGLVVVTVLAAISGVRPEASGKTTWFTLTLPGRPATTCPAARRQPGRDPEAGA